MVVYKFQRHRKYLSGAIIRFCDRLLKLRWYGFYLLNKKPWSHHSFNVNTSKNYTNNISRVTVKIFSDSVKNRHFSRLYNGSKNMFENTGDGSYFSVFLILFLICSYELNILSNIETMYLIHLRIYFQILETFDKNYLSALTSFKV